MGRTTGSIEGRRRAVLRREATLALAVLVAADVAVTLVDADGAAAVAWSLLPLAGAVALVFVQWRAFRRSDEFEQRLQLAALAVGFVVTVLMAFTGGLLEAAGAGSARWWLQATFTSGVLAWVVALVGGTWRAR